MTAADYWYCFSLGVAGGFALAIFLVAALLLLTLTPRHRELGGVRLALRCDTRPFLDSLQVIRSRINGFLAQMRGNHGA
jgi:hypothetical protein